MSGGSSESDENADTVMPSGPAAVTTVTPLAQCERPARKSSGVTSCVSAMRSMLTGRGPRPTGGG